MLSRPALALMLAAFAFVSPLSSQSVNYSGVVDQMISLNQRGDWSAAADLGRRTLSAASATSASAALCPLRVSLLYSSVRLGQLDSARATLATIDRECQCQPSMQGWGLELGKLRAEIPGAIAPVLKAESISGPPQRAPSVDPFWKVGDPAALGLDVVALERHRALCERTGGDACLVIYRGVIVQEWYSSRYLEPITAMSSTKSIAGLLTGMLIAEGKIHSIDDRVCRYLASWCDGRRGEVTLRHVLSMTTGIPMMQDSGIGNRRDKNAFALSLVPTSTPGTTWAYSNEGAQLLAPILDKAAGEPIEVYAKRRLFDPLQMTHSRLTVDGAGHGKTYADMETTPRELAHIGLMMLQHGVWQGKQIVPASWTVAATTPSQSLNPGYGLLWYVESSASAYATHGHLDTSMHIIPEQELIVVRMQAKPYACANEGEYETLLPATLLQYLGKHLSPAR